MDRCKYFLELLDNNFTFNSDAELTTFIKENLEFSPKPTIKYSKINSGLQTIQDKNLELLKEGVDPFSDKYVTASNFLKEEHIIDGELKYISPVFIVENYKSLAANNRLETDQKLIELAKTDPKEALELAIKQIESELKLDEKMKHISGYVSSIMKSLVNKSETLTDAKIDTLFRLVAEYNLSEELQKLDKDTSIVLIDDYIKENFTKFGNNLRENIKNELLTWYKNIATNKNKYVAYINLSKKDIGKLGGITTQIPYISVSPEGITDIYEIKVSRDSFGDWHSSKIKTVDFMLGINRQLLQNIIDTKETSLYIQPVMIPEQNGKLMLDLFSIGGLIDRSRIDSKAGLDEEGSITNVLRKILPAKPLENLEESNTLTEKNKQVLDVMFPKYNFRTKLIKRAERMYEDIITSSKNEAKLSLRVNGEKQEVENTPEGKIIFKKMVEDLVEDSVKNSSSKMINLVKSIKKAKASSEGNRIIGKVDGKESLELQRVFDKYLSDEWDMISGRPELLDAGVILFINSNIGIVEAVSLTINELHQVNDFSLGNTILGQFSKNETLRGDDKILKASNSNIEIMKALTVINNNPDLIRGYSLNSVKVFNILENKGDYVNLNLAIHNFDLLIDRVNIYLPTLNNFKGRKPTIKISDFHKALYAEIISSTKNIVGYTFKSFMGKMDQLPELAENKAKLEWFLKLREALIAEHKELTLVDPSLIQDFKNPVEYLHYLISSGITYYMGIDSIFDYEMPRYGIRTGDWLHWVRTLVYGTAPEYDEKGNKIVGLFQGQHFNTTDALQSVYMTKLHDLISIAKNAIVSDFNKRKNVIINATNTYYEKSGRINLEKFLIGNSDKLHEVFFETHNGKITKEFMLKNPWNSNSNLNDIQRDYLKHFVYFQYLAKKDSNLNLDTYEKFEKSAEFLKLRTEGLDNILKVPLIVRQSILGRMKNLTTDGLRKFIGQSWDIMKSNIDERDVTSDQIDEEKQKVGIYESINGFGRMYNHYEAFESQEYRESLIDKYGVGHFEINLDTIALKYNYESIRESHFNKVLPVLHAAVTTMKYFGWQTGRTKETQDALEDFFQQLKVSVFNTSIIKNTEIENIMGLVRTAQQTTSFMTLAVRPFLMFKELVVGSIKNASYAWSKMYGDDSFDGKDLAKAYQLLINSQNDYNIIYELNTEYRIANRDMNQIVDKVKVDRFGVNFFSNFLYWFNTSPDYVNRLSLFLAKMIKDGTYEAHSIGEDGSLVYDPTKDKRYEHYFKNREKYNFKFSEKDTLFNDQRSLYLTAIDSFNGERDLLGKSKLTEKDMIPKAYDTKQWDSIKTFSDTSYGYYDKDRSPLIKHLAQGIIFGQFMTFWPSKVKYYLGKPETNSKRGWMNHKHKIDEKTGEKIYYYVLFKTDLETGDEYRLEVPEYELEPNDPRAKAWEWHGEPSEGLMYSLGMVTRELITGNLDNVSTKSIKQAKVALHDLLMALFAMMLGTILMKDRKKKDTDDTKMTQFEQLGTKIMYRGLSEFNAFSSIFGSLQTTPAFIDKLGRTTTDFKSMISGSQDPMNFLKRNFSFLEVVPNSLTR